MLVKKKKKGHAAVLLLSSGSFLAQDLTNDATGWLVSQGPWLSKKSKNTISDRSVHRNPMSPLQFQEIIRDS